MKMKSGLKLSMLDRGMCPGDDVDDERGKRWVDGWMDGKMEMEGKDAGCVVSRSKDEERKMKQDGSWK